MTLVSSEICADSYDMQLYITFINRNNHLIPRSCGIRRNKYLSSFCFAYRISSRKKLTTYCRSRCIFHLSKTLHYLEIKHNSQFLQNHHHFKISQGHKNNFTSFFKIKLKESVQISLSTILFLKKKNRDGNFQDNNIIFRDYFVLSILEIHANFVNFYTFNTVKLYYLSLQSLVKCIAFCLTLNF